MVRVSPSDATAALPRSLRSGLRLAALGLKAQRSRGHVPPTLWAGLPGQEHDPDCVAAFADTSPGRTPGLDRGTRLEVVLALAQVVTAAVPQPHFWLTRSGDPEFWATDHEWIAAVWTACDELHLRRSFTLVTRTGWSHQPTGTTHRWKRLRA